MKHPGLSSFWEEYKKFIAEDPANAELPPAAALEIWKDYYEDEELHDWTQQMQEGWAELRAILSEEGKNRRKRKKKQHMKNRTKTAVIALGALLLAASGAFAHNLSTRGNVGTGDNVLIGGVIIEERDCPEVCGREGCVRQGVPFVIRVLGPSLHEFGIDNYLRDPQVVFYDGQGNLVGGQSDYSEVDATTQFTIWQHGLAPEYIEEVALFVVLQPGAYTAVVSGQDGGTGIALLEIYKL